MFTKLPLITEKKITVVKNLCKKDVLFVLIFKKLQKTFQFFLTSFKNMFQFFDIMRKLFHFFRQNAKNVLLVLIKCEKRFNFFDKM